MESLSCYLRLIAAFVGVFVAPASVTNQQVPPSMPSTPILSAVPPQPLASPSLQPLPPRSRSLPCLPRARESFLEHSHACWTWCKPPELPCTCLVHARLGRPCRAPAPPAMTLLTPYLAACQLGGLLRALARPMPQCVGVALTLLFGPRAARDSSR